MKNYLVMAGIALGVVVLWMSLFGPVQKVINTTTQLGAVSSQYLNTPDFSFGGVLQYAATQNFNSASTTICSFTSPVSTSTLAFGSVQITTGTSTAIALEMAKSSLMDATTTRISYVTLASGAQVTLNAFVASTTGAYGSLGQRHTADETDLIFAPNTRLNVKYGASAVGPALAGTCKAVFVQH